MLLLSTPSFGFCVTIATILARSLTSTIKGFYVLRYLKAPSIHQTTLLVIIFAAIFAVISAFVVIFNEFREMEKQIVSAKEQYLNTQKESLILQSTKLSRAISFLESTQKDDDFIPHVRQLTQTLFEDSKSFAFILDAKNGFIHKPMLRTGNSQASHEIVRLESDLRNFGNKGGGVFQYLGENSVQTMLFIRPIEGLDWIVGSGIYLDELDAVIGEKREESHLRITGFILKIATLTFLLYMAGILKYRYLTEQISKDIKILDKAFKEAPITYEFMDETKVAFVEFKEISSHANKMIAKIREKNYDLMRLNTNLEKIVQEKTGALQRSNDYTKELLKQQDRFVNNAIHEINTPLTIIMMNIELHNLKMPKSAYLTKIEAAAKVLENIYEDLGYVVKKNHKPYPKEKLHMSQFLQERMAYFHDVAEGNDVAFEAYVVPDVWIYFSPVELQRIVDNNLSNAIKYATNKSTIEVSLHVKSTEVEFKVTNMGKPIQKPEKLFERYYREDQVRGGFGLGLNIVKEICEANDVAIEVVSKEGKTSFIYTFNAKEGV